MSIVSLQEALDFLGIDEGFITITTANDVLIMKYFGGAATNVTVAAGTYDGDGAAAALETAIDAAFTITSTVAYSSTTYKFTITAPATKTLAYTHSGSDGGLTFGFNDDHAAALSFASDLPVGDPNSMVSEIKDGVEKWFKSICRREFESTSYTKKYYNGNGSRTLYLDDYPITALTRLSIGRQKAIEIYNTSASTTASVSVASTGLVLELNGTTDSTVLFATYTTIATVITAVNALGSGWYARIISSEFSAFKSTELLEKFGQSCIDSRSVYLEMPYTAEHEFEVDANKGIVYLHRSFAEGYNNIVTDYTAGYSSSTMPEDVKLAVRILLKNVWQKRKEEIFGIKGYSVEDMRADLQENIPHEVLNVINKYKKMLV